MSSEFSTKTRCTSIRKTLPFNSTLQHKLLFTIERNPLSKIYENYIWKNGMPYGIQGKFAQQAPVDGDLYFKIISDPYHKRISIEQYVYLTFSKVIYDSAIFNFRSLNAAEQNAWQKSAISETETSVTCHIRNQDDRLILIESYTFLNSKCRECHSFSPHGLPVSIQKMYYTSLGDTFNGTVLYDSNSHPVMYKKYQLDPLTQEFAEMIEENWDISARLTELAKSHVF